MSLPRNPLQTRFTFDNYGVWELTRPLSQGRLQHEGPQCEKTFVYTCRKLRTAKQKKYIGKGVSMPTNAVVKIKYQVPPPDETLEKFNSWLERRTPEDAQQMDAAVAMGVSPTDFPHDSTRMEIEALQRLTDCRCEHVPALLEVKQEKQDKNGPMPGGYIVYILMTELPGEDLSRGTIGSFGLSEMNVIREAFRTALTAVLNCRVFTQDAALRNILWDRSAKKCYIVDFEGAILQDVERDPVKWPGDGMYQSWGLA